jgi:hypothetical protein
MRKAFNSLLPAPLHSLLSPLYAYRRRHFQADWAARTNQSEQLRPNRYIEIDKKALMLTDAVERHAGADASVLDLACNCGRHLMRLWDRGFRKLYGVDINAHAIEYSKEVFPRMQADARLETGSVEAYLAASADKSRDVVITRGISIEFVSPDFPLVREICRVAKRYVVLLLPPAGPPYPRLWAYEFGRQGFSLVEFHFYAGGNVNLFVFASPEEAAVLRTKK